MAFVLNASVAVHEMGHLLLDRLYGLDASIVLDPFGGSYTVLAQPWPADMSLLPVLAGPLANVAAGVLLFLGLWGRRSPYLLPLMLWGPVALIQESTTALVQMITREAGTDWVLINRGGMAAWLIVVLAAVGLVVGLAGLYMLLPVAGLAPETPLSARLGTLVLGMGGFSGLMLALSFALGYSDGQLRNLRLTILAVLIAMLLALSYPRVRKLRHAEVMEVPPGAVLTAMALGSVVFLLFLAV